MTDAPLPLSFPAVLRNSGISTRFAHLQTNPQHPLPIPVGARKLKREHEGKRWIKRMDNAHFMGNPHIVAATKRDYTIPTPQTRATFPEPLPPYLPRTAKVPANATPERDPSSANAGRFSLSLKGMRKGLRKCGIRAELLVRDVEDEITKWLHDGGTFLNPDACEAHNLLAAGVPVGNTGSIFEVSRTPLQLVWYTTDDTFARYVVHCCARYHEVVSFSKELSGRRLTYLLRPNVTRPDHHAPGAIDTPPATDIDYSSHLDTDSDRGGLETDSDVDFPSSQHPLHLSAISEDYHPVTSPAIPLPEVLPHVDEEAWSVVGDTDIEGDESCSEVDLAAQVESISLGLGNSDLDATPKANIYHRQRALLRRRVWPQGRAASSPSRSPVRRPSRRGPLRSTLSTLSLHQRQPFYDYLFS